MNKAIQILHDALSSTGLVQPIESISKGGSASCLCRQVQKYEKAWLRLIDMILEAAHDNNIDVHICRRYIRKDGRMVFGWFIEVSAKSAKLLPDAVNILLPILKESQKIVLEEPVVLKSNRPVSIVNETTASRRSPSPSGPDPKVPKGVVPALRLINTGIDTNGNATYMEEMPLPHVYTDLNKPKDGSFKGATTGSVGE